MVVTVGVAVGARVVVVGVPVGTTVVVLGAVVIIGRQMASVPGVPNSPSGQLHTPAPPPTGWMVRPPLQPEPRAHREKAGTPQMVLSDACHMQHAISTITTLTATHYTQTFHT